jgi:hypothetical protein
MTKANAVALSIIFAFGAFTTANSQTPETGPKVTPLTLPANSNVGQIAGDIKHGKTISLSWAERSSVACFPGTRFEMFNGNHVLYRVDMPARSRITITLTPKDGKLINLYALRQGVAERAAPPNISSAISCESKYPIYANLPTGRTVSNKDDGVRKVEFISVGSPYSILIGAAGVKGLTEGEFTLSVKVEGR